MLSHSLTFWRCFAFMLKRCQNSFFMVLEKFTFLYTPKTLFFIFGKYSRGILFYMVRKFRFFNFDLLRSSFYRGRKIRFFISLGRFSTSFFTLGKYSLHSMPLFCIKCPFLWLALFAYNYTGSRAAGCSRAFWKLSAGFKAWPPNNYTCWILDIYKKSGCMIATAVLLWVLGSSVRYSP